MKAASNVKRVPTYCYQCVAGPDLLTVKVELQIAIAEVQGRSVTFDVSGSDGIDAICKCRHQRFVVDVAKTEQRLAAKAQKAGLA